MVLGVAWVVELLYEFEVRTALQVRLARNSHHTRDSLVQLMGLIPISIPVFDDSEKVLLLSLDYIQCRSLTVEHGRQACLHNMNQSLEADLPHHLVNHHRQRLLEPVFLVLEVLELNVIN